MEMYKKPISVYNPKTGGFIKLAPHIATNESLMRSKGFVVNDPTYLQWLEEKKKPTLEDEVLPKDEETETPESETIIEEPAIEEPAIEEPTETAEFLGQLNNMSLKSLIEAARTFDPLFNARAKKEAIDFILANKK